MEDALTIRKRDIPDLAKDQRIGAIGKARVTLRPQGQILFSKLVRNALGSEATLIVAQFSEESRNLTLFAVTEPPAGLEEEDCFRLFRSGRRAGTVLLSAGALMRWLEYDYKKSGNQVIDAVVNETRHSVSFVLPKGRLTPPPPRRLIPRATFASRSLNHRQESAHD